MQLGVVALICILLLCAFGIGGDVCRTLKLRTWLAVLLATLLLPLNLLEWRLYAEFSLNPAALFCAAALGAFCWRAHGRRSFLQALALALVAGLAIRFAAYVPTPEKGLLYALVILPFSGLLYEEPKAALFAAAASPLLLAFWEAALDLYAFGYTMVRWGVGNAFDAQMIAILLTALLLFAFQKLKRRTPGQT